MTSDADPWDVELAKRMGREVKRVRDEVRHWSAAELSRRCGEAGYPISRGSISQIENGLRGSKFGVGEWLILASVLGVPPAQLLYPDLPDGPVQVLPDIEKRSQTAVRWLVGHAHVERIEQWSRNELVNRLQLAQLVRDSFRIADIQQRRTALLNGLAEAKEHDDQLGLTTYPDLIAQADEQLAELRTRIGRPQADLVRSDRPMREQLSAVADADLGPGELAELHSRPPKPDDASG